ncbi:MAG: cytochrome c maturation protein CcmE [Deltaproteobacteria bacterium]|nr:cytochrome c maturation protein CcmE [Deltaproteobacteria bacterium]
MQNSTVLKIVLTAAVAIGGVVFFVKAGMGSTQTYMMVDELLAGDLSRLEGKELKVHGWVVAGTIQEKVVNQQTIRTFVLHKSGKKIRVFSKGPKPDTFKDQSEVVATGRLVASAQAKEMATQLGAPLETDLAYVVDATDLQAKCPSKYDGAQVNKNLKYE